MALIYVHFREDNTHVHRVLRKHGDTIRVVVGEQLRCADQVQMIPQPIRRSEYDLTDNELFIEFVIHADHRGILYQDRHQEAIKTALVDDCEMDQLPFRVRLFCHPHATLIAHHPT